MIISNATPQLIEQFGRSWRGVLECDVFHDNLALDTPRQAGLRSSCQTLAALRILEQTMPFDSRAYRVLIASPSDVEEEREIAVRVIQEWNDLHAHTRGVVLLPLRWETHSAPEYGVRPQEVINRAIVDQCDLLIGIFWTRIGTSTGVAESGTLEEIARVAKAGKPIMLYFSKIGMDPEQIDVAQLNKLKDFKAATYSNALVESYKNQVEFRDKLARQLELKVRDLQKADTSLGPSPLSLAIASFDLKSVEGTKATRAVKAINVIDAESAFAKDPKIAQEQSRTIASYVRRAATVPIVLAISNAGTLGVRNLYVELSITSSDGIMVSDKEPARLGGLNKKIFFSWDSLEEYHYDWSGLDVDWGGDFKRDEGFQGTGDGWRVTFEWPALQPNRTRLIKPALFITAERSGSVNFVAKVYADSLPEPANFAAEMEVTVHQESLHAVDLLGAEKRA